MTIKHTFSTCTGEEHFASYNGSGIGLGIVIKNGEWLYFQNYRPITDANKLHPVDKDKLNEIIQYAKDNNRQHELVH